MLGDSFYDELDDYQQIAIPVVNKDDDAICKSCGQLIKKVNKHRVCLTMVEILEVIATANIKGLEWVKIQQDGKGNEGFDVPLHAGGNVHVFRLKWFGLLDKQGVRSGLYRCNAHGFAFLAGKASVPAIIYCRDGEVIESSEQRTWISEVDKYFTKPYWDQYWAEQCHLHEIPES